MHDAISARQIEESDYIRLQEAAQIPMDGLEQDVYRDRLREKLFGLDLSPEQLQATTGTSNSGIKDS